MPAIQGKLHLLFSGLVRGAADNPGVLSLQFAFLLVGELWVDVVEVLPGLLGSGYDMDSACTLIQLSSGVPSSHEGFGIQWPYVAIQLSGRCLFFEVHGSGMEARLASHNFLKIGKHRGMA